MQIPHKLLFLNQVADAEEKQESMEVNNEDVNDLMAQLNALGR